MTEIERRAVLDASIACRPACTHPVLSRWPIIEFSNFIDPTDFKVALNQLIMENLGSFHCIRAWSFGDVGCGIDFKEEPSGLTEARQNKWKDQTYRGIPTYKPTDLTLQTHYANNGDIQFKLIPHALTPVT